MTGPRNLLYSVHAKNYMPQELHHPPTFRIALFRVDDPLAYLFVITQRALQNTFPRDRELRATSSADLSGGLMSQLLRLGRRGRGGGGVGGYDGSGRPRKDILPHFRRDVCVIPMRLDAARVPIASEVDIAVGLHERDLKRTQGLNIVVEGGVGVPGREEA